MVKPRDLPIYSDDSAVSQYELVPYETSSLQQYVSVVRTQIWKLSDGCQGAIEKTKSVYHSTEKTTKDIVEFIKTEENLAPRAGIIGLAGLSGLVLARKGGIFKKLFYTGTLTAGAASLCYPYQAVRIAKSEWQWVNDRIGLDEVYQQTRDKIGSMTSSEKTPAPVDTPAAPSQSKPEKLQDKTPPPQASTMDTVKLDESLMDHGQSNPADKDMYSTRS